jgi:carboxylate-amine ligase
MRRRSSDENRFLAARDGVDADLVDPMRGHRVSVRSATSKLIAACMPHARARALDCERELALVGRLLGDPGPTRQRRLAAQRDGLCGLVADLALDFDDVPSATGVRRQTHTGFSHARASVD